MDATPMTSKFVEIEAVVNKVCPVTVSEEKITSFATKLASVVLPETVSVTKERSLGIPPPPLVLWVVRPLAPAGPMSPLGPLISVRRLGGRPCWKYSSTTERSWEREGAVVMKIGPLTSGGIGCGVVTEGEGDGVACPSEADGVGEGGGVPA